VPMIAVVRLELENPHVFDSLGQPPRRPFRAEVKR